MVATRLLKREGSRETQMVAPGGLLQERFASRRQRILASGKRISSRGSQREEILFREGVLPQALLEKNRRSNRWVMNIGQDMRVLIQLKYEIGKK